MFVTGIDYQPSLIFEASLELTIGEAPNFSRKHQTRVKVTDNDRQSSLLWNGVVNSRKRYATPPWGQYYKTFYGRKLQLFMIS